jgi:hypothetical protein
MSKWLSTWVAIRVATSPKHLLNALNRNQTRLGMAVRIGGSIHRLSWSGGDRGNWNRNSSLSGQQGEADDQGEK